MKGGNRQKRMILIIFQKKIAWGKWTILGPKMAYLGQIEPGHC